MTNLPEGITIYDILTPLAFSQCYFNFFSGFFNGTNDEHTPTQLHIAYNGLEPNERYPKHQVSIAPALGILNCSCGNGATAYKVDYMATTKPGIIIVGPQILPNPIPFARNISSNKHLKLNNITHLGDIIYEIHQERHTFNYVDYLELSTTDYSQLANLR